MQQAPGETLLLQEQKACAGSYSVLLKAEALACGTIDRDATSGRSRGRLQSHTPPNRCSGSPRSAIERPQMMATPSDSQSSDGGNLPPQMHDRADSAEFAGWIARVIGQQREQ